MTFHYKHTYNETLVPEIGLGTFGLLESEAKYVIPNAIKMGYRSIDCAMAYENEKFIGEGLKETIPKLCKREDLFITSKLWATDYQPDEVEPALRITLRDLGLDYLDLYLVHWPMAMRLKGNKRDPNDMDNWYKGRDSGHDRDTLEFSIEWFSKTWKAMEECCRKGLTHAIGVSNFNQKRLQQLLDICEIKPAMSQFESHPGLDRSSLIKFCASNGILVTAYSPLTLPPSPNPNSIHKHDDPTRYNALKDPIIISIAQKYHKTPAQVTLRWGIQSGVIVIPKSSNEDRMKENITLSDFILSDEDMDTINKISDNIYCRVIDGTNFYGNNPDIINAIWE